MATQGSWSIGGYRLPEFGITEKIQSLVAPNKGLSSSGGSNLFGSNNYAQTPYIGGQSVAPRSQAPNQSFAPLGASTQAPGGGLPQQPFNPQPQGDFGQGQAQDAARAQYEAELAAEESMFGRNQAMAQGQIAEAGNQEQEAIGLLSDVYGKAESRAKGQKEESGKLTESAIGQAGDTARNTQRSNRNILRSLGILNSTYAADKLQEPTGEFDKERARLVRVNMDNFKKIDDWVGERFSEYQTGVKSVKNQFAAIVDRINTDMRFNGQDRLAALKAANAALQTRLSNIDTEFRAVRQNAENAKVNFASQIANMYLNQNPNANIQGIMGTAMNTANQAFSPQQVGIEEQRRRQGLLSG